MGRVFLLAILVGLGWGGYKVYQNITGLTDGEALSHRYHDRKEAAVKSEGKDSGQLQKAPPVATSSEKKPEKAEPLRVLAIFGDSMLVEAWGIVRPGDELEDGSILESFERGSAVVSRDGRTERRRFRRANEALAIVAKSVVAAVDPAPGLSGLWPRESEKQPGKSQ